jgi:uncharacterized protein (DUF608 family)
MNEKKGISRRKFITSTTIAGVGAIGSSSIISSCSSANATAEGMYEKSGHRFNSEYSGICLNRIAFPVGGIGAGMFCVEGTGAVSHMSVRNHPEVFNEPCMFAAISVKGRKNGARVLEGPVPEWKKFGQPDSANGSGGASFGLPRFRSAKFKARFPFADIDLQDDDIPVDVQLTAWSPFIPTDADNSSLPVGSFEYTFKNTGSSKIEALFSYNSRNFMSVANGINRIKPAPGGFILSEDGIKNKPETRGDFAIFTDAPEAKVDHCWFRGGWFDPLSITWESLMKAEIREKEPVEQSAPGASLYVPFTLKGGESRTIRLMFSWYVPDSDLKYGKDRDGKETDKELCTGTDCACKDPFYKPWYSSKFKEISDVISYWILNYNELKNKSVLFRDTFYKMTLPEEVKEAIAANLGILKSPTVLRQRDGKLWNWEGCGDSSGCCAGSCTHVWNYAQALPHLFPRLERTLRETEFIFSQDMDGHQTFRSALPVRPIESTFYAAADGQLGGIMKMYRDWRISGDSEWMKKMYPSVAVSMDYCIKTWDPRKTGTLEEPHHNTYDIEFWGPDGMCTSFYLGALKAITEMGNYIGKDTAEYQSLYEKCRKALESDLFNGEYFIQNIKWQGLNAPDPVAASSGAWNVDYSDEARVLLQKEGPKYQYGKGCLSDGILGVWIAEVCGLKNIADPVKVASHLKAVHKYNFKSDLSEYPNPQRPSYAVGEEGGLLLCTWPKGEMLSLPFVYSNEVWTGIEYQVASHLMMNGEVDKALDIVRACRKRYDGRVRNPFDEYECGHWYARAMSSYGMIQGLTGVRYDAVTRELFIDSKIGDFTGFISTEAGFGNVGLKNGKPFINVVYGEINVNKYTVI